MHIICLMSVSAFFVTHPLNVYLTILSFQQSVWMGLSINMCTKQTVFATENHLMSIWIWLQMKSFDDVT